jgi:hypothetical protein
MYMREADRKRGANVGDENGCKKRIQRFTG